MRVGVLFLVLLVGGGVVADRLSGAEDEKGMLGRVGGLRLGVFKKGFPRGGLGGDVGGGLGGDFGGGLGGGGGEGGLGGGSSVGLGGGGGHGGGAGGVIGGGAGGGLGGGVGGGLGHGGGLGGGARSLWRTRRWRRW